MENRPPPVPSGFISTLPPSQWKDYWTRYPDGTGQLPFNNERRFVSTKFDFTPPPPRRFMRTSLEPEPSGPLDEEPVDLV